MKYDGSSVEKTKMECEKLLTLPYGIAKVVTTLMENPACKDSIEEAKGILETYIKALDCCDSGACSQKPAKKTASKPAKAAKRGRPKKEEAPAAEIESTAFDDDLEDADL